MSPVFAFGVPGGQEWILVGLVVVLLFGASKLPELARSAGSALGEFKSARYEAEQEFKQVKEEVEETEDEPAEEDETEEESTEGDEEETEEEKELEE